MSDAFLDRLIGDWTFEGHSLPDDGERRTGSETAVRRGRWLIIESDDGARFQLVFDADKTRVIGDFVSWDWPNLWTYDGTSSGDRMILASRGPDMETGEGLADYEDVWEIISPDERTLTGRVRGKDGSWRDFCVTRYRRR